MGISDQAGGSLSTVGRFFGSAFAGLLAFGSIAAADAKPSPRLQADISEIEQALASASPPTGAPRTASLRARMSELKVPAVSIAWFEDGRIVWTRAYGDAGRPTKQRADVATLFQAASLSKAVAAAGALRLVDQRRLALDGNIAGRMLVWTVPAGPPISLRQLLGHSAGLTVSGYPGYSPTEPVPTPAQSLNGQSPSKTPAVRRFAPSGAAYAYSGGGFTVAQELMAHAGAKPFPRLMADLVLKPAGMRQSSFEQTLDRRAQARAAAGHDPAGQPIPGGHHVYPEYAAAGLWTTPSDYARFLIAIQRSLAGDRGALLSPASARAMTMPGFGLYGLGVRVTPRAGRAAIAHGGSNKGFR